MEISINELAALLKGSGALLGLDVSQNVIGLALSDAGQSIASPFHTIKRRKFLQDVEELKKIIASREIKGLVIGLPLNMNCTEGPRAQSVRSFARNLLKEIDLPLIFQDERLSTFEAEEMMAEAGLSKARHADKVDAHAAAIILQDALDRMRQFADKS
ncbi:MAG: Holliday junction resolvase RuvX [Pseudomonadota bacterium]